MAYALQRIEDGKYVSRPGSKSSYTQSIQNARGYDTKEAAEGDRCGNERIVQIDYIGAFRVSGCQS